MNNLPTQYFDLPTLRVAYCETGSGNNLMLLHGNSESKSIFKQYQTECFADFHTYALDSRGHGQSRSVDTEYTIPQFCQDVINFCQEKGIRKTHLVGYSDGGNITLLLAKTAPHLFDRVIAISPNYLASGSEERFLQALTRQYDRMKRWNRLGWPNRKKMMRYDLMLNDIGISAEELKSIRTGMLILYAEREMIKEAHIKEIAELIPNSKLQRIDGCHHMNILNQPGTIAAIRKYLDGNPREVNQQTP